MEDNEHGLCGLSPAADKALRILIVGLLILAMLGSLRWRMLANRLRRCEALYRNYQYEDALILVEPIARSPLARIRLRPRARRTLLLCKAHLAAEERTLDGYAAALKLLEAAREAGADPEDVDEYIEAYAAEKEKLKASRNALPAGE